MHNFKSLIESSVEESQNAEAQPKSFLIWSCFWVAALAVLLPALL